MKKVRWKNYALWVALCEAVGGLSGWLTRAGAQAYQATAAHPPLSPPGIVFPIAWCILFALMGLGAARIAACAPSRKKRRAMALFFVQLGFNFLWSILFFNLGAYALAWFWLLALWALILAMILTFRGLDRWAARLQIPYLLWVSFAAYLNLGAWLLNR